MAQDSIMWTTGATGDGATAYTQAQCILWLHKTFCGADNEGVNKDVDNELAGTGTSSPVAINTGEAYVRGFPYFNSASVDVAIPTPSGNTRIDRIVLRADWTAQTVRITRIAGTEGSGTPPAMVQTDGTTWDIPLYQASITTGGVITLTDEREFLHPNIAVDGDMIDDDVVDSQHYVAGSIDTAHIANLQVTLAKLAADSVDDTKAGNRVPQFYRRQGGSATIWNTAGTTDRTPTAVRMQVGVVQWTGSAAANGSLEASFPTAFSYACIAFAQATGTGSALRGISCNTVSTASVVTIYWIDNTSTTHTAVDFAWLAIGPE